jgi:hypothetical protein
LIHFECFVRVSAATWATCFKEPRELTNASVVNLNPMELNDLCDRLHAVGTLLQSEDAFGIMEGAFRPWPKARPDDAEVAAWCHKRPANVPKRVEALRKHRSRPDVDKHEVVLRKALLLFGKGICGSLERTMGDFLKAANGKFQNDSLSEFQKKRTGKLFSHINWAERPFAVAKDLALRHPSMSLSHLSALAHARVNGTHRSPTAEHA